MPKSSCPSCGHTMAGTSALCPTCSAAAIAKPEHAEQARVTKEETGIRAGQPPAEPKPWPYKHEPSDLPTAYGCWPMFLLSTVLAAIALISFVLPMCRYINDASARVQTINNMKDVALACHAYHDVHRHLPPPTMVVAIGGKPQDVALSWRVAILSHMQQGELFDTFDLSAPWDQVRNAALQNRMPTVYRTAMREESDPTRKTHFQYCTGQGTLFPDNGPVKLTDITDGTSNTILFAEAAEAVIWTRPADMEIRVDRPLPLPPARFCVAFADATVRFIERDKVSDTILRQLINPADDSPGGGWDE